MPKKQEQQKTVKVGARRFEIKPLSGFANLEHINANVCGFTDYYTGEIAINSELAKDCREETLIHEICHCLLDNSGIEEINRQTKPDTSLAELVASILAPRLHMLLKDNDIYSLLEEV